MWHWLRSMARLGLVAFALPLFGCDLSWFTVVIPDFSSKVVEGVWIWRLSDQTGQYQRDSQVQFAGMTSQSGGEVLNYLIPAGPTGQGQVMLSTGLVPSASNPDTVTLKLSFYRVSAPGAFKVSTYNVAGDSPLSDQTVSF